MCQLPVSGVPALRIADDGKGIAHDNIQQLVNLGVVSMCEAQLIR